MKCYLCGANENLFISEIYDEFGEIDKKELLCRECDNKEFLKLYDIYQNLNSRDKMEMLFEHERLWEQENYPNIS